jgi:membrane protease YdiL (CAAX protease family)
MSNDLYTYDHALRGAAWWRGALAIVLLIICTFVVSTALTIAAALLDSSPTIGPIALLALNLGLASQLPIAMGLQRLLFGVRPGLLSSVVGRFRWRWMLRLALVITPLYAAYALLVYSMAPLSGVRLDATTIALFAIVLITTPLQAAGEEYAVRGLVQRSVGSWFGPPRVAFAVSTAFSAVVFAAIHAASDPWLIGAYLVYAVALSVAARGTGGLEASVLIHSLSNLVILAPAALTPDFTNAFARSGAVGPIVLLPAAVISAAAVIAVLWARRSATTIHQEG